MTVVATAADAATFEAYGAFIERPTRLGDRRIYSEWLAPRLGLGLQFHTNLVPPSTLPLTLERVERHPHAAQVFLPLAASRYLVIVMDSNDAGAPEAASAQAFLVPSTLGVAYRAGVWHAGITALDDEASFAVLMWRGAANDDEFEVIPPLVVLPPPASGGVRV